MRNFMVRLLLQMVKCSEKFLLGFVVCMYVLLLSLFAYATHTHTRTALPLP